MSNAAPPPPLPQQPPASIHQFHDQMIHHHQMFPTLSSSHQFHHQAMNFVQFNPPPPMNPGQNGSVGPNANQTTPMPVPVPVPMPVPPPQSIQLPNHHSIHQFLGSFQQMSDEKMSQSGNDPQGINKMSVNDTSSQLVSNLAAGQHQNLPHTPPPQPHHQLIGNQNGHIQLHPQTPNFADIMLSNHFRQQTQAAQHFQLVQRPLIAIRAPMPVPAPNSSPMFPRHINLMPTQTLQYHPHLNPAGHLINLSNQIQLNGKLVFIFLISYIIYPNV
jgi:hypothetical protein